MKAASQLPKARNTHRSEVRLSTSSLEFSPYFPHELLRNHNVFKCILIFIPETMGVSNTLGGGGGKKFVFLKKFNSTQKTESVQEVHVSLVFYQREEAPLTA
jgi:hypothetical protein